jgi:hypothetical protein
MKTLLLALAAAALLLSACTGTPSPELDTLLISGYTDAEGGHVALIDARTLCPPGAGPRCGEGILPDSVRPLPAPPVAFDMVERVPARSELVVLSREGQVLNSPAFLSFFATDDIDPANPVDFAESREAVTLGPELPVSPEVAARLAGQPLNYCPVRVQISAAGRFAAVLNDNEGTCASPVLNNIVVLDLSPPELLGVLVVDFFDLDVLASGLYLDQSFGEQDDRLYWYQEVAVGARLVELPLPRPGADTRPVAAVIDVPFEIGNPLTDLDALGTTFFALRRIDFVPIVGVPGSPQLGEAVATGLTNARRLVLDPFQARRNLLVIGSERVAVLLEAEDPAPQDFSVFGVVDGTIDLASFAYFVSAEAITVFDLVLYDPTLAPPRVQRFAVPGLTSPAFISWAQARLEPLVPAFTR